MPKKHAIPFKTKLDLNNWKSVYEFVPIPEHEFDRKMNETADILLRGYFKWLMRRAKKGGKISCVKSVSI